MPSSRRDFLRIAGAAAATSLIRPAHAVEAPVVAVKGPVVIATWDHGLAACALAHRILSGGGDLLDALEKGVNVVEDDPKCMSVGLGGLPNEDGVVQLDAAIMDGRTHRAGAVAALERIKNPISVARKVMEKTRHVLLAGAGARKFARRMGFVEQELLTPASRAEFARQKDDFWIGGRPTGRGHDTVCVLGLDAAGNLASAVSTSGLGWKLAGRVGDSPIIGAGSYVDNEVGAAAATGIGELSMRTLASFSIVERMRAGKEPMLACREVMELVMRKIPETVTDPRLGLCFIAIDKRGRHGAVALRAEKKPFRYALGTAAEAPALREAPSLLPA